MLWWEKQWVMINLSWIISESRILPSIFDESALENTFPRNKSCGLASGKPGRNWIFMCESERDPSPFPPHIRTLPDSENMCITNHWKFGTTLHDISYSLRQVNISAMSYTSHERNHVNEEKRLGPAWWHSP